MIKKIDSLIVLTVIVSLVIAGCSESDDYDEVGDADSAMTETMNPENSMGADRAMNENMKAIAVIRPTKGNNAKGTITFQNTSDGVRVHAEVSGLSEGKHGFHIHLYGDCSADDGTSAGTHFNFEGSSENPPADINRITGNLGNLSAGANGSAAADTLIENAVMHGDKSIIGRAVIVHAKENDPSQPPIGAAGARLGCGVIGIAQSSAVADTTGSM